MWVLDWTHPLDSHLSLLLVLCFWDVFLFFLSSSHRSFSMAFLVDLCLLDSVPFCLDFIVFLGGSGVLNHGADCFMIFRVDTIWMFGTLSVYGLKVALHSL